ncbi:MAG: hypothetical protein ACOCSK_01290 [Rhodothermales bacterium]
MAALHVLTLRAIFPAVKIEMAHSIPMAWHWWWRGAATSLSCGV